MEINFIDKSSSIFNTFPIKILIISCVISTSIALRSVLIKIIINYLEILAKKTANNLDFELLEIIKEPLGWLIFIAGIWLSSIILQQNVTQELSTLVSSILNLITILIVALIVYRSSPILGKFLQKLALRTETEIDDLIALYLPNLIRIAIVVVVFLKISQVFLGASPTALFGLIGGAGITLGLLLKDIILDCFGTIVIYSDGLYRSGDILTMSGVEGFAKVIYIGLRSTTIQVNKWDSVKKIPNYQMINGNLENWSQNPSSSNSYGINLVLKIDGISAKKTAIICESLRKIPNYIESLNKRCLVWFDGIDGNARVINMRMFANDFCLYYDTYSKLNLAILEILEQENVNTLYVQLRVDPDSYQQTLKQINN